ncbi:MAG: hypothetical protein ACI8P3_003639 [Saprospiraceae bacterium]|jgi:hypothetical protein
MSISFSPRRYIFLSTAQEFISLLETSIFIEILFGSLSAKLSTLKVNHLCALCFLYGQKNLFIYDYKNVTFIFLA